MGRRSLLLIVFQSRLKGEEMKGEGLPRLGLVVVRDGAANNDRSDSLLSEILPIVALPH